MTNYKSSTPRYIYALNAQLFSMFITALAWSIMLRATYQSSNSIFFDFMAFPTSNQILVITKAERKLEKLIIYLMQFMPRYQIFLDHLSTTCV